MLKQLVVLAIVVSVLVCTASAKKSVIELTEANFEDKVMKSDAVWYVEFFAPWCGHCKNLAPEWEKAAGALKGAVKLGAVDATVHGSLASKYGVQGYPTIKVFGANKKSPKDYQGGRTAKAIVEDGLKTLKTVVNGRLGIKSGGGSSGGNSGSAVVELTEESFQEQVMNSKDLWLVEFYAPWCGHCKNLAPEWKKAANQLKSEGVKLGAVDATVHGGLAQKYGVNGYPTIKVFAGGAKDGSAEDYQGGRTAGAIVEFAKEKNLENQEPPEVHQLVDQAAMDECTKKSICFVAAVPHILDSKASGRNDIIEMLKKLALKYRTRPFEWVWTAAGAQPDLEASLEIGGFGYPALAALNAKKQKFATLKGSFTEASISEFVNRLVVGRERTGGIVGGKVPAITTVSPWDGTDKSDVVVEEEFDLSDLDDIDLDDEGDKKDEL